MKNNAKFKIKKVFSARVANLLCHMGFQIIGTEINKLHPQFNVFLFIETEEFAKAFDYIQRIS